MSYILGRTWVNVLYFVLEEASLCVSICSVLSGSCYVAWSILQFTLLLPPKCGPSVCPTVTSLKSLLSYSGVMFLKCLKDTHQTIKKTFSGDDGWRKSLNGKRDVSGANSKWISMNEKKITMTTTRSPNKQKKKTKTTKTKTEQEKNRTRNT